MLDVRNRCGAARIGTWSAGSLSLRLPEILFYASARFPPPPFAEGLLASARLQDARSTIVDRGSVFLPREGPVDSSISPDVPVPPEKGDSDAEQEAGVFKVVHKSAAIIPEEAQALVIGGASSLLREPREFAETIVRMRNAAGPNRILYTPGIALPSNLAILICCGIDVFDSLAVLFESSRGIWLSPDGAWPRREFEIPPCRCPACLSGDDRKALIEHNQIALWEEMELVRSCIRAGNLRELAEKRATNSPWNMAVLRHMDLRHYEFQERRAAVTGGCLRAYSSQSLTRPEIVRFRQRIKERYVKPPSAEVLLLLPCSARKPYSFSRSHRLFREAISSCGNPATVHEVIVTSPLGIVPRELELAYPAAHYDIPVTGDWSLDEAAIVRDDLSAFLERNRYARILAHLDVEKRFVEDELGDADFTCTGRTTEDSSVRSLADGLRKAVEGIPNVRKEQRLIENMTSFARFQFGEAGESLLEGARLRGRYPETKILRGDTQLAMLTERGMLSLTLDGGRELSKRDAYCVEIDDFYLQGSLFAVGVEYASEGIRIGDDVVLRHSDEVRGVGVAQMSSMEMIESERGEAVKVRHALRSKPI